MHYEMINGQLQSLAQEKQKMRAQLEGEVELKNNAENQIQLYKHELDTLVKKINEKDECIKDMKNKIHDEENKEETEAIERR